MRSERRAPVKCGLLIIFFAALLLPGCFDETQEFVILPSAESESRVEVGLGSGVRPLSSGPGEKGSPSWSPSGDRIAFTVDGYVVQKTPDAQDFERQTTKDFKARTVSWMPSDNSLAILGANVGPNVSAEPDETHLPSTSLGLYETAAAENSLEVSRIATGVRAMVAGPPESRWVLMAVKTGNFGSRLALVRPGGDIQPYDAEVEGAVTGLSISPDGERAVLAVRTGSNAGRSALYSFSISQGTIRLEAQLEEGMQILGDPQWTQRGIYYVAGEEQAGGQTATSYDLYQVSSESGTPELVSGVGGDFVASNLKRDPEGGRLAVIGRRNPGSSENLYIFDLESENLEAVTSNEDMQIKTGAEDLTWSGDGRSIVIVARATLLEPKVYSAPADTLVEDFYNLYEVPVGETVGGG